MPPLTAVVLVLVDIHGQKLALGVLLAGAPAATAACVMAQQFKWDAELSWKIIMLANFCSRVTYIRHFFSSICSLLSNLMCYN